MVQRQNRQFVPVDRSGFGGKWMGGKVVGLAIAAMVALAPAAARGSQSVDVELVLAVDLSGSVDDAEQGLQREGLVAAFRDPEVVGAIAALPEGVAVALVGWAGAGQVRTLVAWRWLTDRTSAEDFAARVGAALPVAFGPGGKTAIGDALTWSLAELAGNRFAGRAKIDVSGDGHNTDGAYPGPVRDAAVALGVTINGLAIVNDEPYLANYYRKNVVGGPGAFVMTADDYRAFGEAIRRKLLRELAPGPTAMR
jgi:hypothetical protein